MRSVANGMAYLASLKVNTGSLYAAIAQGTAYLASLKVNTGSLYAVSSKRNGISG